MSGYQALLMDPDGTLIHSQDCICDVFLTAFQTVSKAAPSKEEIMGMLGFSVEVMLTTPTNISPDDKETIADFIEEHKRQYPIHMERVRLVDGALGTVKYIEGLGCPVYLTTPGRRKNAAHILGWMGPDRYMRFMVTKDDVIRSRLDPEPILKGAAACRATPKGCVYAGESPLNVEAGVAVGVFTVAVSSGSWPTDFLVE